MARTFLSAKIVNHFIAVLAFAGGLTSETTGLQTDEATPETQTIPAFSLPQEHDTGSGWLETDFTVTRPTEKMSSGHATDTTSTDTATVSLPTIAADTTTTADTTTRTSSTIETTNQNTAEATTSNSDKTTQQNTNIDTKDDQIKTLLIALIVVSIVAGLSILVIIIGAAVLITKWIRNKRTANREFINMRELSGGPSSSVKPNYDDDDSRSNTANDQSGFSFTNHEEPRYHNFPTNSLAWHNTDEDFLNKNDNQLTSVDNYTVDDEEVYQNAEQEEVYQNAEQENVYQNSEQQDIYQNTRDHSKSKRFQDEIKAKLSVRKTGAETPRSSEIYLNYHQGLQAVRADPPSQF